MKYSMVRSWSSWILVICLSCVLQAGQDFTDRGGDHLWSNPENWSVGVVPDDSATHPKDVDPKWHTDIQMVTDHTTLVIDSTVDAHTYSLHVGAFGGDNAFEMTGGSLTVGNWGLNIGRGGNRPNHEGSRGHMIMSGGKITAPYVIVPEQFDGSDDDKVQEGELTMSGGTIDANWMRIGGKIGIGKVDLSGTAVINLASHLEMNPQRTGEASLDISDQAVLNIMGSPNVGIYEDFIDAGWLTANGGTDIPLLTETDTMLIISATEVASVLGDFDGDGLCTDADIDTLSAAIRDSDSQPRFDLDGNGDVDSADYEFMILDVKETLFGDADLNQAVEFADFLALSDTFGGPGGWAEGDFDGNGNVEFADFLVLSENFGGATAASVDTVPEPSALLFAVLAAMGWLPFRARRHAWRNL